MPYLSKSNPTEAEIREELTSVFPHAFTADKERDFLEACVSIAVFLSNTTSVEQQLKELEVRLKTATGAEFDRVLAHYRQRAIKPDAGKLEDGLRHLLSRELLRLEIHLGFNTFGCITGERVQTYAAFLNADSFRAQLKLGLHWKDPGVPGNHGEYTHRIQWYLLANALPGNALGNPVKLFMRIGGVVDPKHEPFGLWDALFDRNDGSGSAKFEIQSNVTDCRSPESLSKFIVDDANADKWPLLHWFVKARMKKRTARPLNQFHAAKDYVEAKLKKFELTADPASVVGTRRAFEKNNAPGILAPGARIQRTPPD